jgi:hypothetical protein
LLSLGCCNIVVPFEVVVVIKNESNIATIKVVNTIRMTRIGCVLLQKNTIFNMRIQHGTYDGRML